MRGVTIRDARENLLGFDLIDILRVLGSRIESSRWKVHGLEVTGRSADRLYEISDNGRVINGNELIAIATDLLQTIDGEFEAFDNSSPEPWLVIRAVDSSEFDVECDDPWVHQKLIESFTDITDMPT